MQPVAGPLGVGEGLVGEGLAVGVGVTPPSASVGAGYHRSTIVWSPDVFGCTPS